MKGIFHDGKEKMESMGAQAKEAIAGGNGGEKKKSEPGPHMGKLGGIFGAGNSSKKPEHNTSGGPGSNGGPPGMGQQHPKKQGNNEQGGGGGGTIVQNPGLIADRFAQGKEKVNEGRQKIEEHFSEAAEKLKKMLPVDKNEQNGEKPGNVAGAGNQQAGKEGKG